MEKIGKENQQILLDLAAINQDRVDGYRAAIGILDKELDSQLIAKLEDYMQQAQQFRSALTSIALYADAERSGQEESRRMPWVITRNSEEGSCPSRASLIDICIQEETECHKVYQLTLKNLEQVDQSVIQLVNGQLEAQAQILSELRDIQTATKDRK